MKNRIEPANNKKYNKSYGFRRAEMASKRDSDILRLSKRHNNEVLLTILDKRSGILSYFKENNIEPNVLAHTFIILGKACASDLLANVNDFIKNVNYNTEYMLLHMQRYLVFLQKLETLEELYQDSLLPLIIFLEKWQNVMPSSSSDFISILLPLLDSTCEKCLKVHEDRYHILKEKLKEVKEQNEIFLKCHTIPEMKKASYKEKLQLQEPPESFRALPILPTSEDIKLPCTFLRPNIVHGKYRDTEHYLDVQYRLLREDYIVPLRDGIAEYLNIKKNNESFRHCKNVKVYCDVSVDGEDFVNGDLWHCLKFSDPGFSNIKWDKSKRFLTHSLLCLSVDDFKTMFFASVIRRDPEKLKEGLLYVRFEEITEDVLNLQHSVNFVVLETSAYFESYRHNLMALLKLNSELLPFKRYIIDVEKTVNHPLYLQETTTFDMRPLLLPLDKKYVEILNSEFSDNEYNSEFSDDDYKGECKLKTYYKYTENISLAAESVKVLDECSWPTAIDLNLDNSQFLALKAAITKEFAIIQGPPGTGKTYIGLRIVELLLHNISTWFNNENNSLPILIVCYTNHALDQFLEGLLLFTSKIVRIGGRSSNEKMSDFQLYNLKKTLNWYDFPDYLTNREKNFELRELKHEIDKNKEIIDKCTNSILSEYDLKEYIHIIHFHVLVNGYSREQFQKKQFTINNWLGINHNIQVHEPKRDNNNYDGYLSRFETNEKYEDEDDIEYLENERNIDMYDFDESSFNKNSEPNYDYSKTNSSEFSSEANEWKIQKNKKPNFEMVRYIRCCLDYYEAMAEDDVMQIHNVWDLDCGSRWRLYKYWLQQFINEMIQKTVDLQEKLKIKFQEVSEMRSEEDLFFLQRAQIVGMTTNGAAKYRHLLQRLNPAILIVEEAAEVLESHIVTSLAPNTQHVILIGDQQQLRPSPTVYTLAAKYDMNVSLFERMVLNGVQYCRLSVQHRMRPEIAALIVPHIYPNLENHKIVTEFENIRGVKKNVFFVSHSFNELSENDSQSRVNEHEAKFLIQFCRYLILQGYDPSHITILTTYSGQLFVLKDLATDDVKKVRITIVDNYQGEENHIILISFVRSNEDGVIGFLKIPNRVCVALSRAKKGLFCIGNFNLLAEKSTLWKKIVDTLIQNESIGPSLQLVCQNHPDTCNEVADAADFKNVPEGGCSRKCESRLSCGHTCSLSCHLYNQVHENMICKKPCPKTCEKGHRCENKCFEECHCNILTERTLKCGHTVTDICEKPEMKIICRNPCDKSCEMGHKCEKNCFEDCYCKVLVDKTLTKCGHTINEQCGLPDSKIICPLQCTQILKCMHPCTKKCGECKHNDKFQALFPIKYGYIGNCEVLVDKTLKRCGHIVKMPCRESEYTYKCMLECKKILHCSHQCQKKCSESCEVQCKQPCLKTCERGHKCSKKCFQSCDSCKVLIDRTFLQCGHTMKVPCGEDNEEMECFSKCDKKLLCGHCCTNNCGKLCEEKCMEFIEAISPLCGHTIKVECYIAIESGDILKKRAVELFKKCTEPCKEMLPCGHKCTGTCGSCYQQRLHIPCNAPCKRKLICGHKCQFPCSQDCPPCQQPCDNKCIHGKCHKKCSELCKKCTKPCEWSCSHKKCTRPCNEICNRKPCDEPCMKILPCDHPCIGFCGEPCPKLCRVCDTKISDSIFYDLEDGARYVLLEDCNHVFEMLGLNQWMKVLKGNKRIQMKTCPTCSTVIRKNLRYNNIVKEYFLQIENVKKTTKWNKEKNLEYQTILLQESIILVSSPYFKPYNNLSRCLSSSSIRNVKELTDIENIISIATDLCDLKANYPECSSHKEVIKPLIQYVQITCKWITDFIMKYFLKVSEHQLLQLSYEIHRLRLIARLLYCAKPKFLESHYTDFEICMQHLLSYAPFNDLSAKSFTSAFQVLTDKLVDNNVDIYKTLLFPYLKAMNMSTGHWYKCSKGHVYCIIEYAGTTAKGCYECMKKIDGPVLKHGKTSAVSFTKNFYQASNIIQSSTESQTVHSKKFVGKNSVKTKNSRFPNFSDRVESFSRNDNFKRPYSRSLNFPPDSGPYYRNDYSK